MVVVVSAVILVAVLVVVATHRRGNLDSSGRDFDRFGHFKK